MFLQKFNLIFIVNILIDLTKTNKHLRLTIKFNANVEIASRQPFRLALCTPFRLTLCTVRSIMSELIFSVSAQILCRKSSKLFVLLK
jgi:hypothetical protein